MDDHGPGLFVTGHVRSGTSMVAGLFGNHGVEFGRCTMQNRHNPRGYWEHDWLRQELKRRDQRGVPQVHPGEFMGHLLSEGYAGGPWGVKVMPKWWALAIRAFRPEVVVLCYRNPASILASSWRVGWRRSQQTIDDRWAMMEEIEEEHPGLTVRVWPAELIQGDYTSILPAFDALGLEFSEAVARRWIDPKLWRH